MSYKILLIDDSKTQLETLKLHFAKAGFEVETSQNGGDGYQKVFTTAPDVILSDILMPNLNGYQLCRLLKNNKLTKKIPVILLTVLDKKIDKFWGNKSGADKFVSKKISFEQIEQLTRELIEKKPLSQDYKAALLCNPISEETIQGQINNVLDELLMDSIFLNEFRDLGAFIMHEKVLIEKTFTLLNSFFDCNVIGLFFNGLDQHEKNILHLDLNKNPVSSFVLEKIKRDFFSEMPGIRDFTITDFGHEIVKEKFELDEKILSPDEFKSKHIVPITFEDTLLGGICFFNKEKIDYNEFKFYKTMINELLLLFKMRHLYSETEYLSVTDGLTGFYNRRHFEDNIEREYLRTKRYASELSLAMIDIDSFKLVNDTYGHQFGDYVLKEISKLIISSFRKTDMVYRYGGDELAAILTETSVENSLIPLERLREKISEHKFIYNGEEANITISVGVSSNFPNIDASQIPGHKIENEKHLIKRADEALYRAKQDGRNKVVAYSYEQFEQISK